MKSKDKWRVIIIMAHDGDTYFEYNDLEQSMLDQSGFENLSYVIFYYNQKYNSISIKDVCVEESRRYLRELPETDNFAGDDFYDSDTLIKFLKFVKAMEEEEDEVDATYRYFVITWGHGGGLLYFPFGSVDDLLKNLGLFQKENSVLIERVHNQFRENLLIYTQMCSGLSYKEGSRFDHISFPFLTEDVFSDRDLLTADSDKRQLSTILDSFNRSVTGAIKFYTATELNTIFKEGLNKIDVYFALNCYTQMLETGYELRHSVTMMVAPQTTMPIAGINYTKVFATLRQSPGIELADLSETITQSFNGKYTSDFLDKFSRRYPKFLISTVSFSCNFLERYDLLVDSLDQLTALIKEIYTEPALEEYKRNVSVARRRCAVLTDKNYGIIDLNNFLIQLQTHLPGHFTGRITAIKEQFEYIRNQVRAAIKIPNAPVAASGMPVRNPLFLSFFAPAFINSHFINYLLKMYGCANTEYNANSDWASFVADFYNQTSS